MDVSGGSSHMAQQADTIATSMTAHDTSSGSFEAAPSVWVEGTSSFPLLLRAHGVVACGACDVALGLAVSCVQSHLREHPFPTNMTRRAALEVVASAVRKHAQSIFHCGIGGGLICEICNDVVFPSGKAIQQHLRNKHSHNNTDLGVCELTVSRLSQATGTSGREHDMGHHAHESLSTLVLPCLSFLTCHYATPLDGNARGRLENHIRRIHDIKASGCKDVASIVAAARVCGGFLVGSRWILEPGEATDSLGLRALGKRGQEEDTAASPLIAGILSLAHTPLAVPAPVAQLTTLATPSTASPATGSITQQHHIAALAPVMSSEGILAGSSFLHTHSPLVVVAPGSVQLAAFATHLRSQDTTIQHALHAAGRLVSTLADEVPHFGTTRTPGGGALARLAERHSVAEEHDPTRMISTVTIASASSLFAYLGWWVRTAWYRDVAIDGALSWYHLCNSTDVDGGVKDIWMVQAAKVFVDITCSIAETCSSANPGIVGNVLRFHDDPTGVSVEDEDETNGQQRQSRLTILQERSRLAYASTIARFLRFLQNRSYMENKPLPFPIELQDTLGHQGFEYVQDTLFRAEWGSFDCRVVGLGLMAQFYAGSALEAGHGVLSPSTASDLTLSGDSKMSHTASHLMWALKACLVNSRAAAIEEHLALPSCKLSDSRSIAILASAKSHLARTRAIAPDGAVSISLDESARRGGTPVCSVIGLDGIYFIGTTELLGAVGDVVVNWLRLMDDILAMLGIGGDVKEVLLRPERGLISFKPHRNNLADWSTSGDEDAGLHFKVHVSAAIEHLSPENLRLLHKLVGRAEHLAIWRLHVLAGGTSRAADIGLLTYKGAPNGLDLIEAISSHQLQITAIVHKSAWRGQFSAHRYPDMLTGQIVGAWVALKAGVFHDDVPVPQSLWRPVTVESCEREITVGFAAVSKDLLRFCLSFSQFRQVMAKLLWEGRATIEFHAVQRRNLGLPPACKLQREDGASYAALLTLNFGHSFQTAVQSYGVERVGTVDSQASCYALQRFIGIPVFVPPREDVPERNFNSSLLGVDSADPSAVTAKLLECIAKVYGSEEPSFQSPAQERALEHFLKGEGHVISVAACASGKSSLFLIPSLLAQNRGTVVILLCPQRNVAQSAAVLAKNAKISFVLFRGTSTDSLLVERMQSEPNRDPSAPGTQRSPQFSLLITTFDVVVQAPAFTMLVNLLVKANRLDAVVVDEPQINLSAYTWRPCFHVAGALQCIVGTNVRLALTTATLPPSAIGAFKDFFRIRGHTIEVRGDCGYPAGLRFIVEKVNRAEDRVIEILQGNDGPCDGRTLILLLTVKAAQKMTALLGQIFSGVSLGLLTGESTTSDIVHVLTTSKIICATSVIGTSDNIANLSRVIIVDSQYSLANVLQTAGRAARSVESAGKAYLLFNTEEHESMFGRKGSRRAVEDRLEALAWAGVHASDDSIIQAFTSAGVRQFAQSRDCRRVFLGKVFGDGDAARTCLNGGIALCDVCEDSQGGATGDGVEPNPQLAQEHVGAGEEHQDMLGAAATSSSVYEVHATQVQECDEMVDDVLDGVVSRMVLDLDGVLSREQVGMSAETGPDDGQEDTRQPVEGVHNATKGHGIALLSVLQRAIDGIMARDSPKCLNCMDKHCNGFRGDGVGARGKSPCLSRTYLKDSNICFGCGSGCHNRKACDFRGINQRPHVPPGLGRCFGCFLPCDACLGISFHWGGRDKNACSALGDKLFVVLSQLYWIGEGSRWVTLETKCADLFCSPAPRPTRKGSPSALGPASGAGGFGDWWRWLFLRSQLDGGALHLDIVLSHVLN